MQLPFKGTNVIYLLSLAIIQKAILLSLAIISKLSRAYASASSHRTSNSSLIMSAKGIPLSCSIEVESIEVERQLVLF
jgi:hypothetical protein